MRCLSDITVAPLRADLYMEASVTEKEALGAEGWSESSISDTVHAGGTYLAAFSGGTYIGHAGMTAAADEGYITNIAVKPEFRRKGAATALIEALLRYSAGRKLSFLSLEVRESNMAAIALYEKCGFKRVGVRPEFYRDPCENAIIMTYYF